MNKDDLLTLLVYAIMLVAAIFVGIQIIGPALDNLNLVTTADRLTYAIIAIAIGAVINVVLFELGHLIGAKIGGYSIVSFNIMGLAIYKSAGKWKVGIRPFEGLTGETKIMPKSPKSNPKFYIWGPLLLFIVEFVILIFAIYQRLEDTSYVKHGAMIIASVGAMLTIYNIAPFKLDTINDGYRLVLVSKPINVEAYNEMMRIQGSNHNHLPLGEVRTFEEITSVTIGVNLQRVYQLEDEGRLEEAAAIIDHNLAEAKSVDAKVLSRLHAQKLWVLLHTASEEECETYWMKTLDARIRKFIGEDLALETMRVYLLYSGMVTKSSGECAYVLNRRPRALKNLEAKGRLELEEKLFAAAFARVKEQNPTWVFETKK